MKKVSAPQCNASESKHNSTKSKTRWEKTLESKRSQKLFSTSNSLQRKQQRGEKMRLLPIKWLSNELHSMFKRLMGRRTFRPSFLFPFIWSSWVERMPPIQTWIPAGKASSWLKKIAFKKREEIKLVYWFSLSYRPRFESQNLLKIVALKIYISVRMDSPFFGIMNLKKISKL